MDDFKAASDELRAALYQLLTIDAEAVKQQVDECGISPDELLQDGLAQWRQLAERVWRGEGVIVRAYPSRERLRPTLEGRMFGGITSHGVAAGILAQIGSDDPWESSPVLGIQLLRLLELIDDEREMMGWNADGLMTPISPSHSADFAAINWYGTIYEFSKTQQPVIRALWEAMECGYSSVGGDTLIDLSGSSQGRLDQVFRGHPAWGTLIVPGSIKGNYRLKAISPSNS